MMNLVHLIRNAIYHGIEFDRPSYGKKEVGQVVLSFERKGNELIIRVSDDGQGLKISEIEKSAIELGIVTAEGLSKMTEQKKSELIFAHGLSTSREAREIAGRGVGMSAVKNAVSLAGGTINLDWEKNKGCTFSITIPLKNAG
ncbi:MAG: hypothetical protein HQK54_08915 [Oligoflexales bacterium]|nr:hypothetical protein [Oligoflexales bacterium]